MKTILKLALFSLSGVILFLAAKTPSTNVEVDGYAIGDVATDFSLMNVDDQMMSLADFEDVNGYIVIFTCNHCPYSKMYEDRIIALNDTYAPLGYPVIAINPNDPEVQPADSFDKMKERAEEKGFTFPYLFDAEQTIYPQYGATKTPHVFLLDNQRVVKYIGAIDDNPRNAEEVEDKFVENAIAAIQNGQQPDPATTKAIGCSIKTQ